MSDVVTLLGELFLIGCLHIIMNMFIDAEKNPFFAKLTGFACYAGSLFLITRFVVGNLLPQLGQIFRMVL